MAAAEAADLGPVRAYIAAAQAANFTIDDQVSPWPGRGSLDTVTCLLSDVPSACRRQPPKAAAQKRLSSNVVGGSLTSGLRAHEGHGSWA